MYIIYVCKVIYTRMLLYGVVRYVHYTVYTYHIISYTYNNIVYVISIFVIYLFYILYEFEGRQTLSRCIREYYNIIIVFVAILAVCVDGDGTIYHTQSVYIHMAIGHMGTYT